ncbi:MAG: hypothetical protein KGJ02_02925 [Verrucomicrobiota bacterium]|nr:hypothetical protein [Verrucomicrobiota bacterium]
MSTNPLNREAQSPPFSPTQEEKGISYKFHCKVCKAERKLNETVISRLKEVVRSDPWGSGNSRGMEITCSICKRCVWLDGSLKWNLDLRYIVREILPQPQS